MKHAVSALLVLSCVLPAMAAWTYDPSANTLSNDNGWVFNTTGTADALVVKNINTEAAGQDADFRTVKADTGCTIVETGASLFQYKNVGTVGFPASVTKLGKNSFNWGTVTNIVVDPAWNGTEIPERFVYATKNTQNVEFNFGEGVETIGMNALYTGAFHGNSGYDLILPSTLRSLGSQAFQGAAFTSVTFKAGCSIENLTAFQYCNKICQPVYVPDTVKEIGNNAFGWASQLPAIVLSPNSRLERIGSYAFVACSALTNTPAFPDTLASIGDNAFQSCGKFGGTGVLRIPSSTLSLGNTVFMGCGSLKNVVFEDGCTNIGSGLFRLNTSLTNVVFPKSLRYCGGGKMFGDDDWSNMRTGVITWKSVPEFGESTNLFFKCNWINKQAKAEMTITNVLESSKWEKFAAGYRSEYGYEFSIPKNRHLVGTWFSGRNEAVIKGWDMPMVFLLK
ncbi:MAG: leucine-rich repeat protein [Kiritimatiellae bacterium]|nr:leucine-rich repeat protein [Kiritimatiellia bacterium]